MELSFRCAKSLRDACGGQNGGATLPCALDLHEWAATTAVGGDRPHSVRRYVPKSMQKHRAKDGVVLGTDHCRFIARSTSCCWLARRVQAPAAPSSPITLPLLSNVDHSQLSILLSLSNPRTVPDLPVRHPVDTVEDPTPSGSWERTLQRSKTTVFENET